MMLFDTHAHYNDRCFNDDRDDILCSLKDAGISYVMNVSYSISSAKRSLEIADKYPFVYASVGIHPHDAAQVSEETIAAMERLLEHPKAAAVGEIGLDYHYDNSPRGAQKDAFRRQLDLARKVNKPVIVHMREATNDTLEIVRDYTDLSLVFHCFPGSRETADIIVNMGWHVSFTGVVTFKNAARALDVAKYVPQERLMLETDCPYMAPDPHRGDRNSSLYLPLVAEKIAKIRGMDTAELADVTTGNALRFFGIDKGTSSGN